MRIVDPTSGRRYVEERRRRLAERGQPRELGTAGTGVRVGRGKNDNVSRLWGAQHAFPRRATLPSKYVGVD